MTAAYIINTYSEARRNLIAAFEAEGAAKFKYQKQAAVEDQQFWVGKVANMQAAAKRFSVVLPEGV